MDAAGRIPGLDLVSIRWERVQLILETRIPPGAEVDPTSLELSQRGGPGRMPPTCATTDGDRLTLRFNVMVGPGLVPLATGRWELGAPISREATPGLDPAAASGVFALQVGRYTVTPDFEPGNGGGSDVGNGTLVFEVGFDPTRRRIDAAPARPTTTRRRVRHRLHETTVAIRRAALRVLVAAARRLQRRGRRRILFTSRLISTMSGNLKVVRDRMVERELDREYVLETMLKPGLTDRWAFRDRFRLASSLARADVIVLDDSFPPLDWVAVDPGVGIIQLWHASGAFKTVGYSRTGKPGDLDPWSSFQKDYTAAIVSSDHDVPFYAEAFGIPESRVIPTGIPRMDRFFDPEARAAGEASARAAFPGSVGRWTVLLAPTYRGETIRDATYAYELLDYAALHAMCVERDAVVIIRMHPFVQQPPVIPEAFRDRILDGSAAAIDVNDLLFAVDLLITDYSSIVFEYSTLGRPMLFYAYDLDEYVAARDFYEPFESFVPGKIVRTFAELLDAIRRDDYEVEKVADFAARHFAHLDAGSTDRVIDQLIMAP
ncbi:MAG: CDP-glycerol glycerophosphotransferase family protein [Chloroflexota bacterium]